MTLVENRMAYANYEILEELEAGIELAGFEVKSVKNKQGSLKGAYVSIRNDEVFLIGAHIPPYQAGNTPTSYDSYHARKLLLTKHEIKNLIGTGKQKGLTIVPLSMYNKRGKIKVAIAIVRSRKKHDKREVIKKREADRDILRTLKTGQ